ncbi:MAG: Rhodanese-like protein [Deltaproteobacteria bacterium]|nr:Rhodanese-like protein [Deltaproteobacteria bacterium]
MPGEALRTGLVAAIFAALLAMSGCSRSEPRNEAPPAPSTEPAKPAKDPEAARKLIAAGAVVLDVRTPDEYREDHLPMGTNVPVGELSSHLTEIDKLVAGDKSKPIVVYCAAGSRAAKAKRALEAAGYTNVVNGGGLDDLR